MRLEGHDADVLRAYCRHDLDDGPGFQALVEKLSRGATDDHRVHALKGNLLARAEKYQEAI